MSERMHHWNGELVSPEAVQVGDVIRIHGLNNTWVLGGKVEAIPPVLDKRNMVRTFHVRTDKVGRSIDVIVAGRQVADVYMVQKDERKRGIDGLRNAVNGMKGYTSIEQEFIEKMYDAGIRVQEAM